MIYLYTSALVKLVVREPESAALASWLDECRGEDRVTSVSSRVELVRAAHRVSASATTGAHQSIRPRLTALCGYDRRLLGAAEDVGFPR